MLCDDVLVVVEEVAFYVTATTKTSSLPRRRQALLFSCLCIENGLSHAPRTFTIRVEHLYEIRNFQFWLPGLWKLTMYVWTAGRSLLTWMCAEVRWAQQCLAVWYMQSVDLMALLDWTLWKDTTQVRQWQRTAHFWIFEILTCLNRSICNYLLCSMCKSISK